LLKKLVIFEKSFIIQVTSLPIVLVDIRVIGIRFVVPLGRKTGGLFFYFLFFRIAYFVFISYYILSMV